MPTRPLFAALALTAAAACSTPTANPDAAPDLSVVILTGDGQVGAPATELPAPLVAVVQDGRGRPVRDQLVNFRVLTGGGSVFAGAALSDRHGMVREWWTLGPEPGPNTLEARAANPTTGEKLVFATFTATAQGEPTPADPLAGTWTGTRGDGVPVTYVFANLDRSNDLVARLSRIPGVALPLNSPSAYPSFPLAELPEQSVEQLTGVLEWAVGEVTRSRDGMMESAME